jgi:hypothetical protein
MKRLLAYLFIVLGLGLTFSVSAHAYVIEVCNFGAGNYLVKKHSSSNSYSKESVFKYANSKNLNCETHFRNDDKDLYKAINKELKKTKYKLKWAGDLKNISRQFTHTIFDQKYKKIAKRFNYTLGKHLPKMQTTKKQTQIAKKEPIQTEQKINKEFFSLKFCSGAINTDYGISSILVGEESFCEVVSYSYFKSKRINFKEENLCINENLNFVTYTYTMNCKDQSIATNQPYYKINYVNEKDNNRYTFNANIKNFKEEKKDNKLVKISNGKHFCITEWPKNVSYPKNHLGNYKVPISEILYVRKFKKDNQYECKLKIYQSNNKPFYSRLLKSIYFWWENKDNPIDDGYGYKGEEPMYFISYKSVNKIINDLNLSIAKIKIDKSKTQIAKAEPTITPKKKVKVAKKEPKQEEFKPENKDIDNDAPIIEIAQNITVDSQTYTLKGKVKDKSKLYLEANGRPIKISKRGNFELEGFVVDPDAGDKIKIVAIDQWKNKSEKKISIKVEFKEIAELRSYEKPNPSKIKVKQDKNKIAIIIGIEKYKSLKNIDATYANRDANAFRAYANRALGIPNKNIKVLIDENATRGETLKALTLWLPQIARGKNKDIYVFFAGHGLASDDGKNLYILPQDGDAALLQYTALSRLEIFDLINRVEPKSVTMFFDTCYSGQTRDERMLVAGLRPIRLVAEEQEVQNNFTIFTASNYDQTSGSIEEAKHGIFSYYLMMGMQGNADSNKDQKITNGELIAYLKQNVSEEAFINNRQQEPMLSGDPDKVLIKF